MSLGNAEGPAKTGQVEADATPASTGIKTYGSPDLSQAEQALALRALARGGINIPKGADRAAFIAGKVKPERTTSPLIAARTMTW